MLRGEEMLWEMGKVRSMRRVRKGAISKGDQAKTPWKSGM